MFKLKYDKIFIKKKFKIVIYYLLYDLLFFVCNMMNDLFFYIISYCLKVYLYFLFYLDMENFGMRFLYSEGVYFG